MGAGMGWAREWDGAELGAAIYNATLELLNRRRGMTGEKINYVEFAAADFAATKAFFAAAFGWLFTDYGEEYTAFAADNAGLDGGFYRAPLASSAAKGGALVVLYSKDLEATREKIQQCGGKVVRDIFSFPGGRRFHFTEPSGNEFAVWSDVLPG